MSERAARIPGSRIARPAAGHADQPGDWQGIALVGTAAVLFSTGIIFIRSAAELNVMSIAFFRALFAFMFLCILLVRFHEPVQVAAYRLSIPRLVVLGCSVGATAVLYMYAVQHTTAANAVVLNNSAPIYVAVLGPWLLKEPRAPYTWLCLGLAVIGIACISDPARLDLASSSISGIVAAALSAVTYAFTMILGRSLRGQVSGLTRAMWSCGVTALILLPWAIVAPRETVTANLTVLIPMGVIALGLPYLLFFLGLGRVNAQMGSMVALLEPVSGVLIGLTVYQEIPTVLGAVGGLLILLSIIVLSRS
ncbi:MAG: EamA family transporter [Anaerolineae bacterium]|nr:EamA family transporter [Anaerolineae bacterium]